MEYIKGSCLDTKNYQVAKNMHEKNYQVSKNTHQKSFANKTTKKYLYKKNKKDSVEGSTYFRSGFFFATRIILGGVIFANAMYQVPKKNPTISFYPYTSLTYIVFPSESLFSGSQNSLQISAKLKKK